MITAGQVTLRKQEKPSPEFCRGWTLLLDTDFYERYGLTKKQKTTMAQMPHLEDVLSGSGSFGGVVWVGLFLAALRKKYCIWILRGGERTWTAVHGDGKQ